jgi:CBS domain containing-hemolysin-like protein
MIEGLLLVFLSLLTILLTGAEAALSHSDKLNFEYLKGQGNAAGKILADLTQKPTLVSGILLGSSLLCFTSTGMLIYVLTGQGFFQNWYGLPAGFILFGISLAFTSICRLIFLAFPEGSLLLTAFPLFIFYRLFYLISYLIVFLPIRLLGRILGFADDKQKNRFRFAGLGFYFQYEQETDKNDWQETQEDSDIDNEILNNALSFKEVLVKECMTPRTEIAAVMLSETTEAVKKKALATGHSKILIYKETIDEILGYCHIIELFRKPATISEMLTPVITVTEMALVSEVWLKFNRERKSMAVVLDEFGGTAGIITMEDIVEVIFGEIQDEYDTNEDWTEQQLNAFSFLLSARHEISYLNEKYELDLPEGDYETLGGLLLANSDTIPEAGTEIIISNFRFQILSVKNTKIETVKLTILNAE